MTVSGTRRADRQAIGGTEPNQGRRVLLASDESQVTNTAGMPS